MVQHVTEQDVRRIAEYVRIALADDEIPPMTAELNAIIEGLRPITEYDLEGVEPTFHPIGGLSNGMREDARQPGFTQAEALASAPRQQEGSFLVPSILGGGGA